MSLDQFMSKLRKSADEAADEMAVRLLNTIVRGFGRNHGGVPSQPGNYPNSQTGFLRNSFNMLKSEPGKANAYVGSDVPYARYLQTGAHIRPRTAKALAIPLSSEAKRAVARHGGSARAAIDEFKADKKNPIGFIKTQSGLLIVRDFLPSRGGRKRGGVRQISEALFLITKEAVIHPRPWATLGIRDARQAMMDAAMRSLRKGVA